MTVPLNLAVQTAAKCVLHRLVEHIKPESTEASIARFAALELKQQGYPDTWYYDCPAFVLLGSRSLVSVSGRGYKPSEEPVGERNLITVDLSPRSESIWGDCARSFYVEDGICRRVPISAEFVVGYEAEHLLHEQMQLFVRPDSTFHQLYEFANDAIRSAGFENLDFLGNVGHSIAQRPDDRLYVESGNHRCLGEVPCFTFEPHIRHKEGRWGFKHENIYFFDETGIAIEL